MPETKVKNIIGAIISLMSLTKTSAKGLRDIAIFGVNIPSKIPINIPNNTWA
jgi:hypothetical protein